MCTLVILSDTHRSDTYIQKVLQQLSAINPDQVWHLGDDYQDADCLIDAGYAIERVPGTWTEEYANYTIDNRKEVSVLGWRFFLTHTPEAHFNDHISDPDPQAVLATGDIDFFCHGHTHHPKLEMSGDVCVLNPGHLKEGDRRGYPPSYAILTVSENAVSVRIQTLLEGTCLLEKTISR